MIDRMPTQTCQGCGRTISTTRCPFCYHEHFDVSRATSADDAIETQPVTIDVPAPDTLPDTVTVDTPFDGGDSGGAGTTGGY